EVKLVANNTKVINEYTYLSYHLYDKTGDVILYENERIPINLDKQGEMLTVISINLKTISNKDIKKGVVIQFDIVDEEKAYWFSNDASIGLDASSITFQNNYLKRVGLEIKKEILDNQIVFFINILCCFSVVVAILVIRKKHIFES
uniref:hypothetical protein n=1 Tax=Anaerosporobacter sp. TaxID=1872529 RepID=UPI00286F52A7